MALIMIVHIFNVIRPKKAFEKAKIIELIAIDYLVQDGLLCLAYFGFEFDKLAQHRVTFPAYTTIGILQLKLSII